MVDQPTDAGIEAGVHRGDPERPLRRNLHDPEGNVVQLLEPEDPTR